MVDYTAPQHLNAAFEHEPIVEVHKLVGYYNRWDPADFDAVEQRILGLTMDLVVAEILRREAGRGHADPHEIVTISRLTTGPSASVTVHHRIGNQGSQLLQSETLDNIAAAHLLIKERRIATQRRVLRRIELRVILPEFSAHQRLRLDALDANTLLPPQECSA